ncbi:uncharacterized protein LOC141855519 isoform X2 [Brevipalpus obovatus]|uniref:uncharacterized protein LOC141855519 isoform X2 n=1 Tax=Brevipalpus obovatus TaxID=246614 RepID=UPI003D9EF7F8
MEHLTVRLKYLQLKKRCSKVHLHLHSGRSFVYVIIIILIYFIEKKNIVEARKSLANKKKVVIIGEMADMYDFLANSSNDNLDETDDLPHNGAHDMESENHLRVRHQKRKGVSPPKNVFVPVAAYSVTHSRKPVAGKHDFGHRMSHFRDRQSSMYPSASTPGRTTESAVYGYLNRPEIVEFKGQYFYGPNPVGTSGTLQSAASNQETPTFIAPAPAPSIAIPNVNRQRSGLGTGGLLLATLPLVLAPMLSYLFTPMIIPVTATIAAGRRKKRSADSSSNSTHFQLLFPAQAKTEEPNVIPLQDFRRREDLKPSRKSNGDKSKLNEPRDRQIREMKVVANFLQKMHFDETDRDKAMANFLKCDGLLTIDDHCLERLSCEFSDPMNYSVPELDRSVAFIIISHIMQNAFISKRLKHDMRAASNFGKQYTGQCGRYKCRRINPTIMTVPSHN